MKENKRGEEKNNPVKLVLKVIDTSKLGLL